MHTHLECIGLDEITELAAAADEPLPKPPDQLFLFDGLDPLLDFLDWSCGLVRTSEQLARLAYRFSEREAASGVGYADVVVNPTHWPTWRQNLDAFVQGLDAGFREAEEDGLPWVGLCLSLLRQQSATEAAELVDWMIEARPPRVVALSIDGNETAAGRTGPRFADAFARAAAAGIHRTVHAGESGGPEGVWDAIELLEADRIDHGVRAIEDPDLVAELADRGIPLGVCPTSNVHLGLYPDWASHPLEKLRRGGVRVSVNTDGPPLIPTSLEREYALASQTFDWSGETIEAVARTSIESAFCDDDVRRRLLADLDAWAANR